MKKTGKGWVPVQGPKIVCLLEPLYVKRWGYEEDRTTLLAKLYSEAQATDKAQKTIILSSAQPHLYIAQHHPLFAEYWEALAPGLRPALKSLYLHGDEALLHDIHFKVVEAFVQNTISERMQCQQERKLWTSSFLDLMAGIMGGRGSDITPGTEPWKGPWDVLFKRVVKTGTYYPASGYEGEYDPACLCAEKTHVLYWVEHKDKSNFPDRWADSSYFVEKANTTDWTNEWSARVLMEAK